MNPEFGKLSALPTRFADFYRAMLGPDADLQIQCLLAGSHEKIVRLIPSRFDFAGLEKIIGELQLTIPQTAAPPRPIADDAWAVSNELASRLAQSTAFEQGKFYIQSFPSYFVIKMLPLENVDYILDTCASPGGKAIHCYDRLNRQKPVIVNEPAGARRLRLTGVLKTYAADDLPLLGLDAGLICQYVNNEIPLIVLDAPCSGEAHIISQPQRRKEWTPRQTRMLAQRQLALASAAVHALRPGGLLLYSTCALSPVENELLIQELLCRFRNAIEPYPWPAETSLILNKYTQNYSPLARVGDQPIDPKIAAAGWRFRPQDFGEPFFAVLLKKTQPTVPKKPIQPFPIQYERTKGKAVVRLIKVGPGRREFLVPISWPDLPPLPYLHIGR